MVAFNERFARGKSLLIVFGLREKVKKPDFPKSRDFSIIFCRTSIFSLCLVWADIIAVRMVEVTALEIKYCIVGCITDGDILEVSF